MAGIEPAYDTTVEFTQFLRCILIQQAQGAFASRERATPFAQCYYKVYFGRIMSKSKLTFSLRAVIIVGLEVPTFKNLC